MRFKAFLTLVATMFQLNGLSFEYDGRELVRNLASKLCPYTNFCHINASDRLPEGRLQPCCRPCYCDDKCWELDNCCPDKEAPSTAPVLVPCRPAKVKSGHGNTGMTIKYYRIVDSCPPSENNKTLFSKCRGDNSTKIEDYTWVFSNASGPIFQNSHCAACHGVQTFTRWNIATTCTQILQAKFDNVLDILLSDMCDIINVIPEKHRDLAYKYECFDSLINYSDCNNYHGEQLNPDIATACERNTWPYFYFIGKVYSKNVFCHLCVFGEKAVGIQICPAQYGKTDSGASQSFGAMIDFLKSPFDWQQKKEQCRMNEVANKYLGKCQELFCTLGKAPIYGRCESILSLFSGLCIDLMFSFEVQWNNDPVLMNESRILNYTNHGEILYYQFRTHLGFRYESCKNVISELRRTDDTILKSKFILFLRLYPNSECSIQNILQKVNKTVGTTVTVLINGKEHLDLKVHLDGRTAKREITNETYNLYHQFIQKKYCTVSSRLESSLLCPRIELKRTDAAIFSDQESKSKSQYLSFFGVTESETETTTTSVCLDEYLAVMSLSNVFNVFGAKPLNFLIISIVCLVVINTNG